MLGHVFYDFFTSPLDLLVLDRPASLDPTENHTISNKTNLTSMDITSQEDQHLRDYLIDMSDYYMTGHLLLTLGADINFEKAEFYF